MNIADLIELLREYPQDADVKISLMQGAIGGADLTVESSEDWPNAVVLFADPESTR
jgi:predicted dinucleotide-utilizing enzyme